MNFCKQIELALVKINEETQLLPPEAGRLQTGCKPAEGIAHVRYLS